MLDARDAVGAKMSALWSRGEVRDYIDINTVVESGRFSRDEVLALADQFEATPLERRTLANRLREVIRHGQGAFVRYGVDLDRRIQILARFTEWADEIDPPAPGSGGSGPAMSPAPAWEILDTDSGTDAHRPGLPGTEARPGHLRGIGR